jgi:hypothetical protein
MVSWRWSSLAVVSIFGMLSGNGSALAESLGTFTWQLSPSCNVLTLTIGTEGAVSGSDDGCGAGQRQGAVGSAYSNPDGTVGISLTIVTAAARPSHVQIVLAAGSASGTWKDDTGNSGTFAFNPGPSPKGSPRDVVLGPCPPDSVKVGPTCIDKYEASVWYVPSVLTPLIQKIRLGTVTAANFEEDWVPAPVQLALDRGGLAAFGCSRSGNDQGCKDIYAVSIPGVRPARFLSWFQASAAARNAGKRLPSNAEWQAAALGTPEGSCITTGGNVVPTGSTVECVSHVGAYDMVGNMAEWVADWVPASTTCGSWGSLSNDTQCLAGADTSGGPGALIRGGGSLPAPAFYGTAGVFSVDGSNDPGNDDLFVGFRAAR